MKPTPSTLAQAHPDHPKLADLGVTEANSAMSQPGIYASPTQQSNTSASDNEDTFDQTPRTSMLRRPGGFADGPNARSKSVTVAEGDETFGALNCHPAVSSPLGQKKDASAPAEQQLKNTFRVGDAHSFVYDYAGIRGQGYFAVFDGHAGKHAAEWCGQNFHEYLLDATLSHPDQPIPDLLNKTFHAVDARLSHFSNTGKTSSGCTAVTAFLRIEPADDAVNPRGFSNPKLSVRGLLEGKGEEELEAETSSPSERRRSSIGGGSSGHIGGTASPGGESGNGGKEGGSGGLARKMSGRRIRDFVRGLTGSGDKDKDNDEIAVVEDPVNGIEAIEVNSEKGLKRVLYTANVGDARAVLCRGGKAVRLTYDHKGSDHQEAKRITDAGGFVMNNRVNGVLAVTRSLGDTSMKEFVVGSPYTTETALDDQDEFLIVACDGLWDVCEDQDAVDIIRPVQDPQEASKRLLDHAITNYSTDNLSVMVVRFYGK